MLNNIFLTKMRTALLLLLVLALPANLAAYVYFFTYSSDILKEDGFRFHWNSFPVTYAINQNGTNDGLTVSSIEYVIDNSFKAWDSVSGAEISFNDGGLTSYNQLGANNINLVIFDTNTDGYTISTTAGPSVVGLTINSYSPSDGRIADSDIIFNDQEYSFSTTQATDLSLKRINLQDVATHEIGHLLGLDHTWIEHATMWPYTRDGQSSLSEDDRAGISNLYPASMFNTAYDSLTGRVYNADGDTVVGVYVSAISDSSGLEEVAALSDTLGRYTIKGLKRNTGYYLRVRTVDLKHVGQFIRSTSDSTVYIPKYYPDASSKGAAVKINTAQSYLDYDFNLTTATLLARYDMSRAATTIIPISLNPTTNHYMAVRFPLESLPNAFKIHGMTFFNNDLNMAWPQIMLTSGTDTQPDIVNPIRQVSNYVGAELGFSDVEWDAVQLTNNRLLWVVFRFPDKAFIDTGDGPALGADSNSNPNAFQDLFYSSNGGVSFTQYNPGQYDLKVYLTAEITSGALLPAVELNVNSIDFGSAKVGRTTFKAYPVRNNGSSTLELFGMYSTNLAYTVSADRPQVEPDAVDTLRVAFKPFSAGTWNGTLELQTNDPTRPSISIQVTGKGVHPKVQLAASSLTFDSLSMGAADSLGLVIRSTGTVPLLAWGWNTGSASFTTRAAADTLEIAAGDSATLRVRFAPLTSGSHSAVLSFTTDDSARTTHQVALSGYAAGDPNAPHCDMTADGRVNIIDVLFFILLARRNPTDPRLDWNGSGSYTVIDVMAMLDAIRRGTCPDISGTAFLSGSEAELADPWLETLNDEDRAWLRDNLAQAGLSSAEREQVLAALNAAGGGRGELPAAFSLEQNHPNPFNPSTAIKFSVPDGAGGREVSLKVYSISGRLVATLVEGFRTPGTYTVYWDGTDSSGRRAASGVYIYRLQAGGQAWTRKMVLLK